MSADNLSRLAQKELYWRNKQALDEACAAAAAALEAEHFADAREHLLKAQQLEQELAPLAAALSLPSHTDRARQTLLRTIGKKSDDLLQRADVAADEITTIFDPLIELERALAGPEAG